MDAIELELAGQESVCITVQERRNQANVQVGEGGNAHTEQGWVMGAREPQASDGREQVATLQNLEGCKLFVKVWLISNALIT